MFNMMALKNKTKKTFLCKALTFSVSDSGIQLSFCSNQHMFNKLLVCSKLLRLF